MRLNIFMLLFPLLISNDLSADISLCKNIYIWDFTTSKGEKNALTKTLSNEIEDILTQIDGCTVLQRRNYATIQKQIDNEVQISNVEGISFELKEKLRTIEAQYVLFGEVEQDFSFNVNLRLRFEHLLTKAIKTSSIFIKAENIINTNRRVDKLKDELLSLINKIEKDSNPESSQATNETEHVNQKNILISNNYKAIGRIKPLAPNGVKGSSMYSINYRPYNAVDQNTRSYYVTQTGKLAGEKLIVLYKSPIEIHKLEFYAPINKDGASIKEATLYFPNGFTQHITLDWKNEYAVVKLAKPIQTSEMELEINSVTDYSKQYVAVYELKIFGKELKLPKSDKKFRAVNPQNIESSSSYNQNYLPSKSSDSIISTYWCSQANRIKDEYVKFDFGSEVKISKIKIYRPVNSDGLSIKKAKLYYDDNSYQSIEFRGLYEWEEIEIKAIRSSFVELVVEETFSLLGGSYVSIYEIQFFEQLN